MNENYKKYEDRRDKPRPYIPTYKDEELLNELRRFYKENGKPPTREDFVNNPGYPSFRTYQIRFGSWANALKRVGYDVESMVKQGILGTNLQKGRFAEMTIRDHFNQHHVDLAGENKNSSCDGICPNGKTYDVKSSKLYRNTYYRFGTNNKYKEEIEIYYFLAFNSNYTELKYAWRVPGEIAERDNFIVGLNSWSRAKFTVDNMKEYDITDKVIDVIGKFWIKLKEEQKK